MEPALILVAKFQIEVGAPIAVGETSAGLRRVVPILGGSITGPRLHGAILAAGADYQLIQSDGFTMLDARYVAKLAGGELVYVVNTGVRYGPPEAMARLIRGEETDPSEIYFRTTPRFETDAPAYAWLTRAIFIGAGVRHPDWVDLTIYEVR